MIKAVIFDVGGVLQTETTSATLHLIADYFAVPFARVKALWPSLTAQLGAGAVTEPEFWQQFKTTTGANRELPAESLLLQGLRKHYHPNPAPIALAKRLRSQGLKTAILSNTIAVHANFLRQAGLYDGFDPVVLSFEVHLRKPDPLIYQLTLEKLGVTAPETVFIDDSAANAAAATSLGLHGLHYTTPEQLEHALARLTTPAG
jgi:putative hydrolase of the HAD superfamily